MFFLIIFFLFFWIILYNVIFIIECHLCISTKMISIAISFIITCIIYQHILYHKNSDNILHIGISPDYYPFTFIDQNNKIDGFDIDLFHEIGKSLNKKVEFIPMQFEALIPSLQLNTIDALIGGLGYSEEREKTLLSSKPYYYDMLSILSLPENRVHSLHDVKDQTCVTISGYNSYDIIIDNTLTDKNNILCTKSFADGLLYLDLKKAKFFFTNSTTFAGSKIIKSNYNVYTLKKFREPIVIFFNKNNILLKENVDQCINIIQSNNILKELKIKWNL